MIPRKILVADGDVKLLQAIRVHLRSAGFEVLLAQDAERALERARTEHPDLLLLGLNMPVAGGGSVSEHVQSIPDLEAVPVIYLTAAAPEAVDATALGAAAILRKPFDAETLVATVREALGLAVRSPGITA